ncbi:hypothetical protein CsatA_014107 [Cannabis sativa]
MLSEKPTFSSRNPHFFKIILTETLKENKIRVPQYFVEKCGETLTERVFVKLPCGSKWPMKLENDNGKFWLQNGWPEFMKHYSLKRGHMLTFRYDGNSEIYAVIFDTNTVEIDYPSIPVCFDKSTIDGEIRVPKREVIDTFPRIFAKKHLSDRSYKVTLKVPNEKKTWSVTYTYREHERAKPRFQAHNSSSEKQEHRCKSSQRTDPQLVEKQLPSTFHERVKVLEKDAIEHENSLFKIVIQPSNKRLVCVPLDIVEKYIRNEGDAILSIPNGRQYWTAQFKMMKSYIDGNCRAIIYNGWKKFMEDNNLEVGDVCVFELLNGIEISFQVLIVRVSGNLNHQRPQASNSVEGENKSKEDESVKIERDDEM